MWKRMTLLGAHIPTIVVNEANGLKKIVTLMCAVMIYDLSHPLLFIGRRNVRLAMKKRNKCFV